MDPLSSLRFAVSPELRAGRLPKAAEAFVPRTIPGTELEGLAKAPEAAPSTGPVSGSFENALGRMVSEVNQKQLAANDAVGGMVSGQNVSLNQAMISMEEASVSFQLMVEVRNKLLDSYQELMRMQI